MVDDLPLMQRVVAGDADAAELDRLERDGNYLRGAFYLGSPEFYDWLRNMTPDAARGIAMRPISEINALSRDSETLERLQRREGRFFNTCMMASVLGSATSDALEDGRVVSGVGGQYNFVAMAHELDDGRSVLMLRATREAQGELRGNILWDYGHTTIPRHLRDIYITEYGIADVRGLTDEDVIRSMCGITDARDQDALIATAKRNGKLAKDFIAPKQWRNNTASALQTRLAPFRADGSLPDYPLGSDFTRVEEQLVKALGKLKAATATPVGKVRTIAKALFTSSDRIGQEPMMTRMGLASPRTLSEKLYARLLAWALRSPSP